MKNLLISYSLPQQVNAKDTCGESMATLAAQYGRCHVLRILHSIKADMTQVNNKGWTPVHVAVAFKQPEVLRTLHNLKVRYVMCRRCFPRTPDIHSLVLRGTGMGYTPAHLAAQSNDVMMLKVLAETETDLTVTAQNVGQERRLLMMMMSDNNCRAKRCCIRPLSLIA